MAERELLVRILGDDRDLQRALGNTDRRLTAIDNRTAAFGRNIKSAFATAGISLGTAAVFAELSNSIDAASALNEEISKSQQIFGDSADAIQDWSETTAQSFGISQRAALEATGIFGNLFRVVGIAPTQAAALSTSLVELAADLASFNNADPTEVLTAIRSGLIGEAEPLRRYGVLLSEARVQQAALEESGKENVKALTNQEKALARYNIILQDTAPAQGDFARTSESLANQQRVLQAQIEDLEATVGTLLIPKLTDLVATLNDVTGAAVDVADALVAIKDLAPIEIPINVPIAVDILFAGRSTSGLKDLAGRIADEVHDAVVSGLSAGAAPFKNLEQLFRGEVGRGFTLFPAPVDTRGTSTKDAADKADDAADKSVDDAKRAAAAEERAQKAWDEFVKGMGLKLDKARLTEGVADDLAALREFEAAILRRIASEGKTFKLVELLTNTRLQINSLVRQQTADAEQAGVDAFNATIDALNLGLTQAQATEGLKDDQAALQALERAILNRIESEGETTDLLRQLFQVREEQKNVARQLREQARERRQERQFEALGLTAEGEERVPGGGALRRRAARLEEQIKGTTLDTEKNRQTLERIQNVLAGNFRKVGREVRQAILDMLNDISGALDEKQGPLTKTSGLNTKKILAGLGLSPEEINALRGRLSGFNTAGRALAIPSSLQTGGGPAPFGRGIREPIVVESHTTINLDGQRVANVVTRNQQKTRRRNPKQKRGPNRNR